MTPEEHFKDRPDLLAEPLVQSFIEEVSKISKSNAQKCSGVMKKAIDIDFRSLNIVMNSEAMVWGGKSYKDAVHQILELHNEI